MLRNSGKAVVRLLLVVCTISVVPSFADARSGISITAPKPGVTLYKWNTDRCEDEFIPDAPARAFRRADGQIELIATHRENWMLLGPDIAHMHPFCRSILRSSLSSDDPTGKLWIEATYTRDGQDVMALISRDLSSQTKAAGCKPQGGADSCWVNEIVAARSTDMGQSFSLLPEKDRVVASLGTEAGKATSSRYGVFTTSNIVKNGKYYFMIAYVQGQKHQSMGNCLFRSSDPSKQQSWLAWTGADFNGKLTSSNASSSTDFCTPISPQILLHEVRSLSYLTSSKSWVAVFTGRYKLQDDKEKVPGFYFSTSDDLINWGNPKRIVALPVLPRKDSKTYVVSYPSLLDPESSSRNFDTIDHSSALLFYTLYHLKNGGGSMNRDLAYVDVDIN